MEDKNLRVTGEVCQSYIDVVWTEVFMPDGSSTITELTWTEYQVCTSDGGGTLGGPIPEDNDDGSNDNTNGGTPKVGGSLPDKCGEGMISSPNGCTCEFGEDENGNCLAQGCENGFLLHPSTQQCYCPAEQMEIIGDQCKFKCPPNYRRDQNGNCVAIEPCDTEDEVFDAIQNYLSEIWAGSNALAPMGQRIEQGGWIVANKGSYQYVPWEGITFRVCGIDGEITNLPDNIVGVLHSHPFFLGDNTLAACEEKGEESYSGGPSRDDKDFLQSLTVSLGNFGLVGYVIDGNQAYKYFGFTAAGAPPFYTIERCGY